jgi:hypothetical protein
MSDTTLIRGGTVVTAERQWRADVLIAGETVAAVGESLQAPAGAKVIDACGAFSSPACGRRSAGRRAVGRGHEGTEGRWDHGCRHGRRWGGVG